MGTLYHDDVVAWAEQQAALIRARDEAGLKNLPANMPWKLAELMDFDFLPMPAITTAESGRKDHL